VRYVDVPEAAVEQAMRQMGMSAEVVDWLMSLNHVVKQGWAGALSDDVRRLAGHPPRRFVDFVTENVSSWR
jgi:NAD(P)H dehydrogenase (quinone)